MRKNKTPIQTEPMPITKIWTRKHYASPLIKKYGKVANLTKGGAASVNSDSGMNNMYP